MNFLENIFAQLEASRETPVLAGASRRRRRPGYRAGAAESGGARHEDFFFPRGLKKVIAVLCRRQRHRLGRARPRADGGGRDRGSALCAASGSGTRRHNERLLSRIDRCGDAALRDNILQAWPEAPPHIFAVIFSNAGASVNGNPKLAESDPVTTIYTSGTSGEAKGVMLTAGNVGHMLGCTSARLIS